MFFIVLTFLLSFSICFLLKKQNYFCTTEADELCFKLGPVA